jgi:dihydroflavonol-4-reductase
VKPLLTTYSIDVLDKNNAYDSSKAARELGYRCRPYKDTIMDEVHWLQNQRMQE